MSDTTTTVSTTDESTFLLSNKKTTTDYRALMAKAVAATGTIVKIVKMAFGTAGETDASGNPTAPTDNGPLNNVVLTKTISSITFPTTTQACFTATIDKGEVTATINEIALIDEDGNTAAKMRLLTGKGADSETGITFNWYMDF